MGESGSKTGEVSAFAALSTSTGKPWHMELDSRGSVRPLPCGKSGADKSCPVPFCPPQKYTPVIQGEKDDRGKTITVKVL